jgi:roadblock/LC7 domain-containing protein
MSELDQLVSREGVLVAGRFGPDWRVADQKSVLLFNEDPVALEVMSSFCASIQMLLTTMSVAMSRVSDVSWQPVNGWAVSSGVYSFAMHGDRFALGETAKLGSTDELLELLRHGKP